MKEKRCGRTRFVISVVRPFAVVFALAGILVHWLMGGKNDALIPCAFMAAGVIAGVLVGLRAIKRMERRGYEFPLVMRDRRFVHPKEQLSENDSERPAVSPK